MEKAGTDAVVTAAGFLVSCDVGKAGRFRVDGDSVSVRVGQHILRQGTEEMWDSVVVEGKAEQDGTLVVRVLVCNPDWDAPLQIACNRSCPQDPWCLTALGSNLDHIAL